MRFLMEASSDRDIRNVEDADDRRAVSVEHLLSGRLRSIGADDAWIERVTRRLGAD